MINLRKQRQKFSRNSLLMSSASTDQALIQIKVNSDCFKGQDVDELNSKDALMIYNFLCSLLAYGLRTLNSTDGPRLANIVVLVDSERVPVKVLRVILRACQNALAYKIKHAVVIEPDSFFDQQLINLGINLLEAYDFKTTMCARPKIWKYVDVTGLYHERPICSQQLNGWTDIKKKFEDHFCSNPGYFATDTSTSCIAFLAKFLKKDQSVMIELANGSKKLIEPKVQLQEERLQINSDDEEATNDAVDQTETVQATNIEEATRVPEHIIEVLKERNARIQEIITWVEGPCEQCFDSFGQICKSVDEVQRLENRHSELTTEFRETKEKASELFDSVSFLRNGTHGNAYDPAMQLALRMNELLHTVQKRMQHAVEKLEYLKKFHLIASELYEEADTFVGALCSDPKNLELGTLKSELRKLDYKIRLIEKRFEAAVETCTKCCALVKDERPNITDQPAEISYLSDQLSSLNERRRRCLGLADIRRLKVQQFIQLLTCEQDAQQVIDWIKELQQNAHAGDPITKITKFEDVAKKMEKYGDQLCEVSLLLRRSLRLEVQPQVQLQQNLQLSYNFFNQSIKCLKMSQSSFHK